MKKRYVLGYLVLAFLASLAWMGMRANTTAAAAPVGITDTPTPRPTIITATPQTPTNTPPPPDTPVPPQETPPPGVVAAPTATAIILLPETGSADLTLFALLAGGLVVVVVVSRMLRRLAL